MTLPAHPRRPAQTLRALPPEAMPPSPEARAYNLQLTRIDKLRAQLDELDALAQAHRAERHQLLANLNAQAQQARRTVADALDEALRGKLLAPSQRERAIDQLAALAEAGLAEAQAQHDRHSQQTLAQKRQARAEALRARIEAVLGERLDEPGASADGLLRAAMERLRREQQDTRERRRQARQQRRQGRDTPAPAAQEDADATLRRLFRQLASALHPDREADPATRALKTTLMAEANAAYERRDLVALLHIQQRAALSQADGAAGLPADKLAALTLLLKQQVAVLERERAERQNALAHEAGLPDGVAANANTLRQARIDEERALQDELAQLQRDAAQVGDSARLKRWLNALRG